MGKSMLFAVLAGLSAVAAAQSPVVEFCEKKWAGQYAMQQYCLEQERKGALEVQAFAARYKINELVKAGKDSDPAVQIWLRCVNKWEPQYSMAAYCISREAEAARVLNKL